MVDVSNEEIMEFKEQISQLSERINTYKDMLHSEDETKRSLILPFFMALGYDIFNPSEFISEIKCDIGIKKGERVDYAILKDSKPIIIIECKHCGIKDLTPHLNQLYRYFNASKSTKFGILTNGIVYKFYTDFETSNIMDEDPFWEFDMSNIDNDDIELLKMFCKISLDIDSILKSAKERRYKKELEERLEQERKELEHKLGILIRRELQSPSDDLIRYFIGKVDNGNITQECFDTLSHLVKNTIGEILNTPKIVTSISQPQNTNVYTKTLKNYSEKDYSRYSVNGEGNYGKCKTPAIVIQTYLQNRGVVTIDELKDVFPNHLQGSHGVVRDELEIREKEFHRFIPLILGNKRIYVSNQWTPTNFQRFMQYVNLNIEGITIKKVE